MDAAAEVETMENKKKVQFVRRPSATALKVLLIVLVVFSTVALAAQIWVIGSVRAEVQTLKQEAAALEQDNRELQEKIDSLGSVGSVMDIAREVLGLVSPDTIVIQPEQ